jgi:trans-aconitate 2-methyltransferase
MSTMPTQDGATAAPRDWDGATYDRISDPMLRMGATVLDRLQLTGDEHVVDAGCGSGRVTELLAERLPRGRVVALDGSPSMLDEARRRLARFGDRVEYVAADLGQPLPVDPPVDAILSTAAFHWVPDHDALFRNLAAVLRPGGRMAAQCGGVGNLEAVFAILETVGDGWRGPQRFETPEATTLRLEAAGFRGVHCRLLHETVVLEAGEPLEAYLRTIVLGAHLERLPPEDRDAFVRTVASRMAEPVLEYVRLDIDATRR